MTHKDLPISVQNLLSEGSGYLWGYNYDYHEYGHGFWGIYDRKESEKYKGWLHASNYVLLEKCQVRIGPVQNYSDFLLAAANKRFEDFSNDEIAQYLQQGFIEKDGDSYKSLCNVMTQAQYDKLCEICSDEVEEMSRLLTEIIETAANVMKNHAPSSIQEQCKNLADIKGSFENMAHIMQNLCDTGYLSVPYTHDFLTVYTVI